MNAKELLLRREFIFAGVLAIIFYILFNYVITFGHLHEDAYILFQYSKNLALGKGIVFDSLSGPTEGATDFLWMILLGGMNYLGIDIAVASGLLNAFGLFIIIIILQRIRGRSDFIWMACSLAVLFSGGSSAALGGFSTLAYGAVFLILVFNALNRNIPIVLFTSLILSLFRPDGVILSFGTCFATLLYLNGSERKRFLLLSIPIIIAGVGYFVWRMNYFDMILPLPLMVKQKGDMALEGLSQNWNGISNYAPLLLTSLIFIFYQKKKNNLLIICLGPFLLLCALSIAHQSQNIGYRFQFPIVLSVIALSLRALKWEILNRWKVFLLIILFIPTERGFYMIRKGMRNLTGGDYITSFPQLLKKDGTLRVENIAITEAGRFPYWLNAQRMIDLVGLNSKLVVQKNGYEALREFRPSLIFIHHSGRYNLPDPVGDSSYFLSSLDEIQLLEYEGENPVLLAPAFALKYARENGYVPLFVKYGQDKKYNHVYFLSNQIDIKKFVELLKDSFMTKLSYKDSIKILKPAL